MTSQVDRLIQRITEELREVPGVIGVVLGGSRAKGTAKPDSDIDIGIYYDESQGFKVENIARVAQKLDDEHRDGIITPFGEWGAWVNGGGWLVIEGYHVDFLFRDVHRVSGIIDDCSAGLVSAHYQTGHPHAYLNVMYMGELAICRILSDSDNRIQTLKAKTVPYPKTLKDAMVGFFTFEASFSLMFADKTAASDDITYVTGHCFRCISCLNQVLFAKNELYCINEKRAVAMIETFPIKPANYKQRLDQVITLLSSDTEKTKQATALLQELVAETEAL
ncbi:nucleotidyltransferase domain-containing protein [Paenibacillus sp. ISL-20]|uniref:nucleotidyltransferase domain-containing protein n=1 Tax=Paenibacillus sp. ISL-20 TaxID=2819163 RepID=UPI001BE72095|nr:nucleotidyltransferase domain-containing protein [Paenibacillus sp. ISL-20]MBT2761835.1 nucleotidyltransferase domain-containing protein [Paenibacillus sp. ISL-20]